MIPVTGGTRLFLFRGRADMRKGFDGLSGMVESHFTESLFSGALFIFVNVRRDRVKILYWDRDGWALWSKRLESGTYAYPFEDTGRKEITAGELSALLEGIDLSNAKRRKRYVTPLQRGA